MSSRRNIPAYAGKTQAHNRCTQACAEHPRVCGENDSGFECVVGHGGTSPRMRGKPSLAWSSPVRAGNIPAYAGKTALTNFVFMEFPEHPRVCGENSVSMLPVGLPRGTSPRMRGKPIGGVSDEHITRNIPAYAGKTILSVRNTPPNPEHPRVCGENVCQEN